MQITEDFQGSEMLLYDTTMVDICHHVLVKTQHQESTLNYGLWAIMMYQCRFIGCNKCATLAQDVDRRDSSAGAGSIWELSVTSFQFFQSETETTLKNNVF